MLQKVMLLTFLYFGTLSLSVATTKSHASVTMTSNALDKPDLTNNIKNTGGKENFVSGTEVERRMFSGLVYNSPKSPTVPAKVKKLENKGNNLRFQGLSLQEKTQQRAEAIEKMKLGVCACKFEDSVTPTKVMGEAERGFCAPKTAICGFCMNAAYVSYWNPSQDSCAQYIGEAKQVCEAVAGGASKAAEDLEHLYKTYGPQFGATAVWCKQMGCCNAE